MPPRIPTSLLRVEPLQHILPFRSRALFSTTPNRSVDNTSTTPPATPYAALMHLDNDRPGARRAQSSRRPTFDSSALIDVLDPKSTRNDFPDLPPRGAVKQARADVEVAARIARERDLNSLLARTYTAGDVYAPHDLSPTETQKWRQAQSLRRLLPNTSKGRRDAFDILGINPVKHYKNIALMGDFVSEMGRIKHGRITGLRPRNQRKVAKAVRRAIAVGFLPSSYKHPEMLPERVEQRNRFMNVLWGPSRR